MFIVFRRMLGLGSEARALALPSHGRRGRLFASGGLALSILSSCAPGPHVIEASLQQPGAPARSVCVLSVVGKVFALQKVGVTVFSNEHATTSIAGWGIDDLMAREIARLTKGHVAVKAIPVAIDDPASIQEFSSHTRGPFTKENPAWAKAKRDAAADPSCSMLLTVTAGGSKVGSTNQFVAGIGMLEMAGIVGDGTTFVHALLNLYLYDARTMQQLSWAGGWSRYRTMVDMLRGPNREVDKSWRIPLAQIAASRQHREAVEALVRDGLADVVPRVLSFGKPAGKGSTSTSTQRTSKPAATRAEAR